MSSLGENLLRYNIQNRKFISMDFETEGLNLYYSRPWEVCWIEYQGYKEVKVNHFYLKWPNLNVSEGAARATHFDPTNIEKYGQDPKEVLNLLSKDMYNKDNSIVFHNGLSYDAMIFNNSRKLVGFNGDYSFIPRCYDTNSLSKAYKLGLKKREGQDFMTWQFSLSNFIQKGLKTRVSVMCQELGIECDENRLHEAHYDVQKTSQIFFELIKKMEIE